MCVFYQRGVVDFKSRLCHKVVVRLEGDSELVGFGVETGRRLLPAPATPNDSAGFRLILHFHKVIPAAQKRAQNYTETHGFTTRRETMNFDSAAAEEDTEGR